MTNTQPSLRSDYCPICAGIGVRQLLESVSGFIGIRTSEMSAELGLSLARMASTMAQMPGLDRDQKETFPL